MANNNLTSPELSMILYLSPLVTFTHKEFIQAQEEVGSTSAGLLVNLRRKGFISVWSKVGRTNHFIVTTKGNTLVNRMHKMYMLEEEIPMSPRRNVIARSNKKKDEILMELFKKFNDKIKE